MDREFGFFGGAFTNIKNLNENLASEAVDDIQVFLGKLSGLRVLVVNASGFGHQASTVNVMQRVIALGYTGTIDVLWEEDSEVANKLKLLLPGFTGSKNETMTYQGVTLAFTPVNIKKLPIFAPKPLGITGGIDAGVLENPAKQLNVAAFLQLQPVGWEGKRGGSQNVIWYQIEGADDAPINLGTVPELGKEFFGNLGFYMDDPVLSGDDWKALMAAIPEDQRGNLSRAQTLITFLQSGASVNFLPAYGLLLPPGSRQPVVFNPYIAVITLVAAIAKLQRGTNPLASRPAVFTLLGQDLDNFWDGLQRLFKIINQAELEEYLRDALELPSLFRLSITGMLAMIPREKIKFSYSGINDEFYDMLKDLRSGEILLVGLDPVPPPVFNLLLANATLPYIFEGQATANLALNLGKPFLKLAKLTNAGSLDEILYQLPMMLPVKDEVYFLASGALLTIMGNNISKGVETNISTVADVLSRALDASGKDPFLLYFAELRTFYHSNTFDRVVLALQYFLPTSRQQFLPAADNETPLDKLNGALTANLKNDVLDLYPGAIPAGSAPIPVTLARLSTGAGVQIATNEIAYPPPHTSITVAGGTTSFGGGLKLAATVVFSLAADNETLVMELTLAGASVTLPGAPWFSIADPAITATVSNAGIRNFGSVSGTIAIGSVAAAIAATLPTASTLQVILDLTKNPPSLEGLFQFIGGFNLTAYLPKPLDALANLSLQQVAFDYDYEKLRLVDFTVALRTQPRWKPLGEAAKLELDAIDFTFTVNDPTGVRAVAWTAASQFTLGKGVIDVGLSYPNFTITGALAEGSQPIQLSDLVAFFLMGYIVPVNGEISNFDLLIIPGTPTIYSVAVDIDADWPVPSSSFRLFTVKQLGFRIQGQDSSATGSISGTLELFANNPQLAFSLTVMAAYGGSTAGWMISGKQDDRPIKVKDILTTYLGASWFTDSLPHLNVSGIDVEIHTGSQAPGPYFTFAGNVVAFPTPLFDATISATASFGKLLSPPSSAMAIGADVELISPDGELLLPMTLGETPKLPFAKVEADVNWKGIDLKIAFDYSPEVRSYTITWKGISAQLAEKQIDGQDHWVATLSFDKSVTLGGIVEEFVSWATGYKYGLAAPWNVLNDISLGGVQLGYDFTAKTVTVSVAVGPIQLGFCTITGIGLTYNSDAQPPTPKVAITLQGSFLWNIGHETDPLTWDATDPSSTQAPPGNGNQYLDLRLLALGQHVAVEGIGEADTVEKAIAALAKMPEPSGQTLPPVTYAADNSWLIGTDFGVLKLGKDDPASKDSAYAFTLQVVFDDPNLYALRLQLAGEPAKILGGLDFQVLYRKISDTVGVYQAELTLPAAIRTIQAGIYTIQLPTIGVAIYTNGDFQFDIGFPWNNVFSRSFMIQAIVYPGIPLLGAGGFYFGKLSSATTNAVPAATNGTFNPVIIFGFGAEVGFGKSISYGPLSASFSLTVLGIIQGVFARWNPYQATEQGTTSITQFDGTYYYSITGTFGIAGTLSGSIDFAVVKASVNVSIIVVASVTFTAYEPIVLSVAASVDVSASLEINFGLFSITLHFRFSVSIKETFQIGNQGQAPWQLANALPSGRLTAPLAMRLSSLRINPLLAVNAQPTWTNLTKPAAPTPITGYLAFGLTAAGDGASSLSQQVPCYVSLVTIDAPAPATSASLPVALTVAAPPPDTSFDALVKLIARWVIAAFQSGPMSAAQIDDLVISNDALDAITAYLANDSVNPTPLPTSAIETMLGKQITLTLWGPADVTSNTVINGAFFPMPPDLELTVGTYGTQPQYQYSFADYNTLSATGIRELRTYFNQLAVQVQPEQSRLATARETATASVASFVFTDYFLLIARQVIVSLSEGLRDFKYSFSATQTPKAVVDWINAQGSIPEEERYSVSDLFLANSKCKLSSGKQVTITGARSTVQLSDSFSSIAGAERFGGQFNAQALATENLNNSILLRPGARVTFSGKTILVNGGDSLTTLASRLGIAPQELVVDPTLLEQTDLLLIYAQVLLPTFRYTTGESDTLASAAAVNGMTIAQLAMPMANETIAGLFAPDSTNGMSTLLDLPHLPQLPVSDLLQEAQATGAFQRLAAMASRYHLHGLRLPTDQITPNAPGMWVAGSPGNYTLPPAAGLYALTGQQFPIPSIGSTPFTFSVGSGSGPGWVTFKNGTAAISVSITNAATDSYYPSISALSAYATTTRLETGYSQRGTDAMVSRSPTSYSLGTYVNWISPTLPALPFGAPLPGATSARIWHFPLALSAILDRTTHAINPTFLPQTQTYDEAAGQTVSGPIVNYGWASIFSFTVKRVPAVAASPASATTYEIVGAGAADIILLEGIVAQFQNDSSIAGLWLGYAPDPVLGVNGLQTGGSTAAYGIGQSNLSTVTRPPAVGVTFVSPAVPVGPTALNGNATFLRLIWEAAITAQGGFYLYYDDNGSGLPDSIFDKDEQAELTVVVIYGADEQNQLVDCMNALVFTDPVNPSGSAIDVQAAPAQVTATMGSSQTLTAFAASYYADLADLAHDNETVNLRSGSQIVVNGGTYLVPPDGGQFSMIMSRFGITNQQSLLDANPRIAPSTWDQGLTADTAIRLPTITVTVGTSPGGTSLASLATYYGADVVALVVDNQDVPALFAVPLSVSGGPVTSSPTMPSGSQLIMLERPVPPAVPAPSDPSYGRDLLLNLFSLLGYRVDGNQDFNESHLGVPVGPTGAGGTGVGKLRVPYVLEPGDQWTYNVTLSYDSLLPGTTSENPYRAVGRLLQVDFSWLDVYGNTIISDLSAPQAGDFGTPNHAPLLVGYTDALISLSQWPSINATWQVGGAATAPQLQLVFSFWPDRYQGSDGMSNASQDAHVYAQLAAQLGDPNGLAFSVESSLLDVPILLNESNLITLTSWLSSVQDYIVSTAAGKPATPPADPPPLNFPLTELPMAQLFELTCSFTMTRAGGIVEGEFNSVAGTRSVETALSPTDAGSQDGLQSFAQQFEAALIQATSMLKVVVGPDRFRSGAASLQTLWALSIGLVDQQPISYSVNDVGMPTVFAPAPLSTSLISRSSIPIYGYTSGQAMQFSTPASLQDFANIDIDQWVRRIFSAIDELLSPEYLAPLVVLDEKLGTTELATLQQRKAELAALYASQMAPVFSAQQGASNADVVEVFHQQLLEELTNAYETEAAIQFATNVTATIVEVPPAAAPPNLYGPIVQSGNTVTPGISFTNVKLPLATAGNVPLTFLVSAPSSAGNAETASVSVDLGYHPTNVEHQIGNVQGIADYQASSWLQFVLPPTNDQGTVAAALGVFEIPIVLRSFPATPAMVGQSGVATNPDSTDIAKATQWSYEFRYSLPVHYVQDTVHASVQFNIARNALLAESNFVDAFGWLAEFITVYPCVAKDLIGALATITAETTDQSVLNTAKYAIVAVNTMLEKITAETSVDSASGRLMVNHPSPRVMSSTGDAWELSIREASATIDNMPGVLLITLTLTGPATPPVVPQVLIDSHTMMQYTGGNVPPNTYQYYYVDSNKTLLQFEEAQNIAGRMVSFPALPILDLQDALVTAHVTRNEHLVSDPAIQVDKAFIYRTPDVSFSSPYTPDLTIAHQIDIAQISTPHNPAGQRSLLQHLTALFTALTTGASVPTMSVQITVLYQYVLNPTLKGSESNLPVTVPVLTQPPLTVTWSDLASAEGVSLTQMLHDLSHAIAGWLDDQRPSKASSVLEFSVTIMSGLTTQLLPLLSLSDLVLHLEDVDLS